MPARQRSGRLLTLLCLLLVLGGAARAEAPPPADSAVAELARQIEAELARQREFTQSLASDPLFRHHELWYRAWEDNGIVLQMDRTVAEVEDILLTQLVDLDGQLVAVNAHDSARLPLPTQTLYLDDYRDRPWFLALAAAGAGAEPRIDGPGEDPDLQRAYAKDETCLRITVPVFAGQRLVAVLSHCQRFAPLAVRVAEAAAAPGAERGSAVALVNGEGHLLAGGEPALGNLEVDLVEYPIALDDGQRWTLRHYQPRSTAIQRQWRELLGALPGRAEMAPWPGHVFRVSGLIALLLVALGLVKQRLVLRRPALAAAGPARAGLPRAARRPSSWRRLALPRLSLRLPALRRRAPRAPRLPHQRPMAVPRGPLTPAEKAYELLAALLGALQGTLHALADGSEALAERRHDPLLGRGPGSTLQALRRAAGLGELLRGLEHQTRLCREDAALAPAIKQGMDVFARLGREIGELLDPLAETERRLAHLPRRNRRAGADAHTFQELTDALHATVGVMTALQAGLGRLPQRMLCGTDAPRSAELIAWQEGVDELQDLLVTLARQLGATRKLLELLPSSTGAVLSVRDVSAPPEKPARETKADSVGGSAASPRPAVSPRPAASAQLSAQPAGAAAAPAFELLAPRRTATQPSAAAPRFEIIGGGRRPTR